MSRFRAALVWFCAIGSLLAALALWCAADDQHPTAFVGYSDDGHACAIYVDPALGAGGFRDAELLQQTLATAARRRAAAFPLKLGTTEQTRGRGVFLRLQVNGAPSDGHLEYPASYQSERGRLVISSRTPETMAAAVSWFLERELGVRWFIPGPLGIHIPSRKVFRVARKSAKVSPAFLSRHLSLGGSVEEKTWFGRNRLNSLFEHGHSMGRIFQREDLLATPELAPLIGGKRLQPRESDTNSWQPNLASPLAAPYAANVLKRWLREDPSRLSVPLGMNDTVGYDQSAATLKRVGTRGYFRERPDYSNLVFGFVNEVAREVGREFPDRFVTTYAYDWTENTPDFRVAPNVIPFLTADRVQWFDREFAAADQALIRRWVAAGPRIVGIYDYLYGVTFLVPRPTIRAVAESIPFAYGAGVRAYFAESSPNWGLDGPKAWLVAQLLWNAQQDPAELLDTYYRDFWQEAAPPMREFFGHCDELWRRQIRPSFWLKFFKDENQHLLFPAAERRYLRAQLDAAASLAESDLVRARLRMVSEAFAVTEAFAEFCERREELIQRLFDANARAEGLLAGTEHYLDAKRRLLAKHAVVQREFPLALPGRILLELTRNDPLGSALWRISQAPASDSIPSAMARLEIANPEVGTLRAANPAATARTESTDPALEQLRAAPVFDTTTLDWATSGPWRGHGFPAERRSVSLVPAPKGMAVRWSGCLEETLSQWLPVEPGGLYRASARARAKVSPGNMTFLAIYCVDPNGKFSDLGTIQRLPVGEWGNEVELSVVVRAPKDAGQIGLAVRTLCQVEGDFVEFSQIELKLLEPTSR